MARVYKTVVFVGSPSTLHTIDTIEHEGRHWLVGGWLENPASGYRIPARLICPVRLGFQPNANPLPQGPDFSISGTLPKAVVDAFLPIGAPDFEVLERPDLRFPLPPSHQH